MSSIQRLCEYFRGLPDTECRKAAKELTGEINQALYLDEAHISIPEEYKGTELAEMLSGLEVSPMKASLLWQAYQLSRVDPLLMGPDQDSGITAVLATIPSDYHTSIQPLPEFVAPYAGSLLKYLSSLINSAERELIVVAPYWSVPGVESIKRQMLCTNKSQLDVLVMTPAGMDVEHKQGVQYFKEYMEGMGASVRHMEPTELPDGGYPLVHAKVIIADSQHAYVGSANLSDNGLTRSIEAGVGISGPAAAHLREWFLSIEEHFVCADH